MFRKVSYGGLALAAVTATCARGAVDFKRQIQPVLETNCVGCHGPQKAAGSLRLTSRQAVLKGGSTGPAVVPGDPEKSPLYRSIELAPGRPGAMPPEGPQLSAAQRSLICEWIREGAVWPEGLILGASKSGTADEHATVAKLRERILAKSKQAAEGPPQPYKNTIPNTTVSFEMVPIPGGEFTMGTPESERGHRADESPQHKVRIEPFWMGKYEVTWDEYRLFMFSQQAGERPGEDALVDAISRPTRPYVEMSFSMGINGYPAISMTQHAANKYAEWLSAKTGEFYRLPTEAEWEYACRAGTSGAYSFGSNQAQLGEYAWYSANSGGKYQKVGTKKPNPWGLHDMHGNVMEWTLDQYIPNFYSRFAGQTALEPWARSTRPYPQSVRGGSWNDEPDQLRCGARLGSDPSWKMQDPQLPKSIWYHTDAQWLGFRLIRPLKIPTADEMYQYWNSGVEKE